MATGLSRRGIFGALIGAGAATAATAELAIRPPGVFESLQDINNTNEHAGGPLWLRMEIDGDVWNFRWTGWKQGRDNVFVAGQYIAERNDIVVVSSFPGPCRIWSGTELLNLSASPEQGGLMKRPGFFMCKREALELAQRHCYQALIDFIGTLA